MTEPHEPTKNGHKKGAPKTRTSRILSPAGMSGVALGTVAGAALAGPVGAVVCAALGGAAGEALERVSPSEPGEQASQA